jgi:quinol monooxygenase YgiN
MSENVNVIATIELHPGRRTEFLNEFWQIVPEVRQEAGCIRYEPTIDLETLLTNQADPRPSTVVILETWSSLDALEAHLIAPHMQIYRGKVKSMVKSVTLQVLQIASSDSKAATDEEE